MKRPAVRPRRRVAVWTLVAALAAVAANPAQAYEIYKWVDEKGVVHYSESRPEARAAPVEKLHIPATNPPGYDPSEDYWSVVNQAERIDERWTALKEEREKEEALERAVAAEARIAELERRVAVAQDTAYTARPVYAPFASFAGRRHRFFDHRFDRLGDFLRDRRSPPHRRDESAGPRPGWPGPDEPSAPAVPGFGAPGSR